MKKYNKLIVIPTLAVTFLLVYTNKLSINCPFHKITGLYCPGCGITRCILSILKLDFYQAFRYNPLVFIMLPFIILYFCYKLYIALFNKKDITKKIPKYFYYILLIITVIFGIMRNLDSFIWLAPTKI